MTDTALHQPHTSSTAARFWALIPCAGAGARAGATGPKQYQALAGRPLVAHTLAAFAATPGLAGILVVVAPGDTTLEDQGLAESVHVADCGGASRAASVGAGLGVLHTLGAQPQDWVLVHDAARCLITPAQIQRLMAACADDAVGGLLAQPLADTLKVGTAGRVSATLERSDKWLAQTPQMFRLAPLQQALQASGPGVTDEASAIEAQGLQPLLVAPEGANFKVTYPDDFALAEAVLRARQAALAAPATPREAA
ncbi:2-C-methyl-D-erythritol 4-phosphate cytidylyltransferase [Curvibacter sp. HBC61]|uniref:2-C-methyl-D-erythritol 4-phosphate cytidylyltransferase n=1 Tax=Curvibacter cyanobacteriorum TaxID=3026422 RepID=A0ABT5MWM0_9BURK|nr:2-C-methyl-D-erythritol 4-phosphate cytidylyltransferase [Curvibacter sp. HBC61]MDD0837729.1 2-C-methyl-D-erythritol 4-phosphate cytidylyltransferase [Curvibacter sp. HBC61]